MEIVSNNPLVRLAALSAASAAWLMIANSVPHGPMEGLLVVFLAVYLFWVARIAYLSLSRKGKPTGEILLRIGIFLGSSAFLYLVLGHGTGTVLTFIAAIILHKRFGFGLNENAEIIRGQIVNQSAAGVRNRYQLQTGQEGILWGGVKVPYHEAEKHFLILGSTGSGKTVTLRLYMQSVLLGIGRPGVAKRALIYDPSVNIYPILEGMGFDSETLIVLNPYDQRCRPWWISRDIRTATDAGTLADILVPAKTNGKDDDFWRDATLLLIKAVVRYLNRVAPERWTFRDLLLALRDRNIIVSMIADEAQLAHYGQIYGTDKTAQNIMATVISKVERYEPIAALWHKAETVYGSQPISITDWVHSSSILVLGRDTTAEVQMRELNRVILTRVAQIMMRQPDVNQPQTFIVLDELASLGRIDAIVTSLTEGRKKGVAVAAVLQTESQLVTSYSKEEATTLLGQFNHLAVLRVREAATAKFVSELLGKQEGIRILEGRTNNWNAGETTSQTQQYFERDVVMPGELTGIAPFNPKQGTPLRGFYTGNGNWWHNYPPSIVQQLAPASASPALLPMPAHFEEIEPWQTPDFERLKITHLFSARPATVPTQESPAAPSEVDWQAYFKTQGLMPDAQNSDRPHT